MKVFFAAAAPIDLALGWSDGMWEEKRERIARMRRDTDKALALTAHRLLCYTLKTVCGFMPQPADFMLEPKGKPYIKSVPDVHFSLSHSGGMAMCALHDSPVGADIEQRRSVGAGVAERIMTAEELCLYTEAPDRQLFFFQIWTLKEAFVKYRGTGLGMSMSSFYAYPTGSGVATDTDCEFWTGQPAPGYQAAVCANSGMHPQLLTVGTRQLSLMKV